MLYESLITLMCLSTSGQYSAACNKAGDATFMVAGANKVEGQAASYGESKGKSTLGIDIYNTTAVVGAGTAMVVKQKELVYKIKLKKEDSIFGIEYIKPDAIFKDDNRGGSLGLGWSF
jgi:hypothetical protein